MGRSPAAPGPAGAAGGRRPGRRAAPRSCPGARGEGAPDLMVHRPPRRPAAPARPSFLMDTGSGQPSSPSTAAPPAGRSAPRTSRGPKFLPITFHMPPAAGFGVVSERRGAVRRASGNRGFWCVCVVPCGARRLLHIRSRETGRIPRGRGMDPPEPGPADPKRATGGGRLLNPNPYSAELGEVPDELRRSVLRTALHLRHG